LLQIVRYHTPPACLPANDDRSQLLGKFTSSTVGKVAKSSAPTVVKFLKLTVTLVDIEEAPNSFVKFEARVSGNDSFARRTQIREAISSACCEDGTSAAFLPAADDQPAAWITPRVLTVSRISMHDLI